MSVEHAPVSPGEPPQLSDEDRRRLVEEAIESQEKLAESQLEMARLFLEYGKTDIARRRLREIVQRHGRSAAAREAEALLRGL